MEKERILKGMVTQSEKMFFLYPFSILIVFV